MPTSAYLSTYGMDCQSIDCTITFLIPDNCEFITFQDTDLTQIIKVALNSGEKNPSTIFVPNDMTFPYDENGDLNVAFELPDVLLGESAPGTTKKPRMMVTSLTY